MQFRHWYKISRIDNFELAHSICNDIENKDLQAKLIDQVKGSEGNIWKREGRRGAELEHEWRKTRKESARRVPGFSGDFSAEVNVSEQIQVDKMVEEGACGWLDNVGEFHIWVDIQEVAVFGEMVKKVRGAKWTGDIFLQIVVEKRRAFFFYRKGLYWIHVVEVWHGRESFDYQDQAWTHADWVRNTHCCLRISPL